MRDSGRARLLPSPGLVDERTEYLARQELGAMPTLVVGMPFKLPNMEHGQASLAMAPGPNRYAYSW